MRVLLIAKDKVDNYEKALIKVGIEPVVLGEFTSSQDFDGLLIPGGADVDPSLYGEEINGCEAFDRAFDDLQLSEIDEFFKAGKPIFGTCRGLQILNVYFGGTLKQDIPGHRLGNLFHEIKLLPEFSQFQGLKTKVNSSHHQCIDRLGKDLNIFTYSLGGIPEGFVHKSGKVFGVQWHPERMLENGGLFIYEYFKSLL